MQRHHPDLVLMDIRMPDLDGIQATATITTAKTHVAHLLSKLNARDRVQLVILAHHAGLTMDGADQTPA